MPRNFFEDPELGAWCGEVRQRAAAAVKWVKGRTRRGLLSPAQQRALAEANFPFNVSQVTFQLHCCRALIVLYL